MTDNTALIPSNAVEFSGERLVTTSLIVAEVFGKQHKDVLRSIETVKADCPADFNERNFAPVDYIDAKGERRPMVEMTRDGFTILVMGYRGKKAMQFKLAYIERFNAMEAQLRQGAPIDTTPLEDGIHRVIPVEFQGDTLYLIDADGTPYVHAESIRAGSTLPWYPTHHELRVLYEAALKTLVVRFPDGQTVPMDRCLPLRKVSGWLAVAFKYNRHWDAPERRQHVRAYHNNCDDALWTAWDAYQRRMPPALPDVDTSEWVTIRRDDLRQMTTGIAALNVLLDHGMRGVNAVEASTGERWYGRPTGVSRA